MLHCEALLKLKATWITKCVSCDVSSQVSKLKTTSIPRRPGPFDSFFFSCFFGKCARAPLDQKTPENKWPFANCVLGLFNGMVAGIRWLIHLQQCVFKAYTQAFDLQCIVWFLSVRRDGEKDPQKHFQLISGAEKLLHGRSMNMYMFVYAQNPSL